METGNVTKMGNIRVNDPLKTVIKSHEKYSSSVRERNGKGKKNEEESSLSKIQGEAHLTTMRI